MESCNSYGLFGAMNLIFYLNRAYSHWTGSDTGIYRPITGRCFGSKRFVDYLWVLLAAAGIVLIAPWTNNGINVLGVLFALLQELLGFYIVLGGKYQNNEGLLQLECSLL
jgi:inner membrane transporter RhtA